MATKRAPRARIRVSTPELVMVFRGESVSGHPGARGGPKIQNLAPKIAFSFLLQKKEMHQKSLCLGALFFHNLGPARRQDVAGARKTGGAKGRVCQGVGLNNSRLLENVPGDFQDFVGLPGPGIHLFSSLVFFLPSLKRPRFFSSLVLFFVPARAAAGFLFFCPSVPFFPSLRGASFSIPPRCFFPSLGEPTRGRKKNI